jgi:hypothetical protein
MLKLADARLSYDGAYPLYPTDHGRGDQEGDRGGCRPRPKCDQERTLPPQERRHRPRRHLR